MIRLFANANYDFIKWRRWAFSLTGGIMLVGLGFLHAMNAIVDSNVSTILTALILYAVGTGPVQGFAITLIIGIIASMISAIFVVKTLFLIWLYRRPDMVTLSI